MPERRLSEPLPPGTEFLDAETGGPKSTRETVFVGTRPGTLKIGGKIPAETASFRSTTVSAVREDWMVVCAVTREPVSASQSLLFPVICIFQGQGSLPFAVGGCTLYVSPGNLR